MATGLAESTGRGVAVDLAVAPLMPARSAVARIGQAGAHSYRIAVFSPCYLEDSMHPRAGIDHHGAAILQHLLATGGPLVHVVLLGVPRPSRFSHLDLAAARAAHRANRTMQALAAGEPRATYVSPPSFGSVTDPQPFDADYYERLGSGIAAALLPVLAGDRRSVPEPEEGPQRGEGVGGTGRASSGRMLRVGSDRDPV